MVFVTKIFHHFVFGFLLTTLFPLQKIIQNSLSLIDLNNNHFNINVDLIQNKKNAWCGLDSNAWESGRSSSVYIKLPLCFTLKSGDKNATNRQVFPFNLSNF